MRDSYVCLLNKVKNKYYKQDPEESQERLEAFSIKGVQVVNISKGCI